MLMGCESKSKFTTDKVSKGNKIYECEYTKEDSNKQLINKKGMEVNKKGEPVYYHYTYGYSNIDDEEKYKTMCNQLDEVKKNDKVKAHKDSVNIETVCDKTKNYEVYMKVRYDVNKLKGDEDFKDIDEHVKKYTKEDGTFDKDSWKELFFTDVNDGKYTCNF
jgi:hypothetical protein